MAWANKQKEHKAVKQHSGPTIYLGKDNESKYSSLCQRWDSNIIWWDRVLMEQSTDMIKAL